ncbi:hypothetical protein B0A52_09728 [Exophiala mesophila]|uniref:Uncharacterized protein n=1 Tax=Exophiala mesophila TaxID=212818 RepID=A0A438MRK8_EXOME|nr:hypothetical protein B0A52_09728 [Exophiala mesophila]
MALVIPSPWLTEECANTLSAKTPVLIVSQSSRNIILITAMIMSPNVALELKVADHSTEEAFVWTNHDTPRLAAYCSPTPSAEKGY